MRSVRVACFALQARSIRCSQEVVLIVRLEITPRSAQRGVPNALAELILPHRVQANVPRAESDFINRNWVRRRISNACNVRQDFTVRRRSLHSLCPAMQTTTARRNPVNNRNVRCCSTVTRSLHRAARARCSMSLWALALLRLRWCSLLSRCADENQNQSHRSFLRLMVLNTLAFEQINENSNSKNPITRIVHSKAVCAFHART